MGWLNYFPPEVGAQMIADEHSWRRLQGEIGRSGGVAQVHFEQFALDPLLALGNLLRREALRLDVLPLVQLHRHGHHSSSPCSPVACSARYCFQIFSARGITVS